MRGAYGSTRNVVDVGHEADLADRPHPVDGLELVERVHRLHRDGQADAARDATLEPVPAARLRAHVPSLPHQRKRTRRSPASSARLTTSAAATYATVGVAAAELRTPGSIPGATRSEIITRSFSAAIAPPDSS